MIPGESVTEIITMRSSLGLGIQADSLPVVSLYRNGVLTTIAVSVSYLSNGDYTATFDAPETWDIKDFIELIVTATINGIIVTGKKKVNGGIYPHADVWGLFFTRWRNGQEQDADNLPVGQLYLDGVADPEPITISRLDTGLYSYNFTAPATWVDRYETHIRITAVIEGIDTYITCRIKGFGENIICNRYVGEEIEIGINTQNQYLETELVEKSTILELDIECDCH